MGKYGWWHQVQGGRREWQSQEGGIKTVIGITRLTELLTYLMRFPVK
jgi:hypothetical protein